MRMSQVAAALAAFIIPAASAVLSPSPALAGTVAVKGSDTMVVLGQRWAEEFMKTHKDTTIQIQGGGSGTGISALINGNTDICTASRSMKDAEKKQVEEKSTKPVTETIVARDGLSVYVNGANAVKELSMAQLKGIFTGKITSWKDVGGADAKIIVYSRENSSGTYVFFKEHVLENADYTARAQTLPGTAAVVNAVVKDKNAIGYGGAAFAKGLNVLKIKKDDQSAAIEPSAVTVKAGTYPLSRPLFFYTRHDVPAEGKTFIDWVLSAPGQALVEKVGYFPVK